MLLTMVAISEHIENHDNLDRLYAHGNYIDEVLTMNNGTADYYYAHNHLFSVCALLNDTGTIAERYEYNAYGKLTRLDPDFTAWSGTEAGNPYTFTGRRLDELDSGDLKIMYYRNRYYDMETGRFLTHDPLGVVVESTDYNKFSPKLEYNFGMNLYNYMQGEPLDGIDPFGLYPWGEVWNGATCVAYCVARSYGIDITDPLYKIALKKAVDELKGKVKKKLTKEALKKIFKKAAKKVGKALGKVTKAAKCLKNTVNRSRCLNNCAINEVVSGTPMEDEDMDPWDPLGG